MKPLSAEELVKMRKACRVAAEVLDRTGQKFKLLAADTDFAEAFLVVNPY